MKDVQAAVAAVEEELREQALAGQLQDLGSRFRVVPQQYHKVGWVREVMCKFKVQLYL
jgi:hypothetical protein